MAEHITASLETIREYLRPPGDSGKFQVVIDEALSKAEEVARLERTVQTVVIEIDPSLGA
jgi:hypothetical protein